MSLDSEEKEFEQQLKNQNFVYARPAVKGFKAPYEPEMMVAGAQWSVGNKCDTREQAESVAEKAADEFNTGVRAMVSDLIIETGYSKAKP